MSTRQDVMLHIVSLFSGFPPEIQAALATGYSIGALERYREDAEVPNEHKDN